MAITSGSLPLKKQAAYSDYLINIHRASTLPSGQISARANTGFQPAYSEVFLHYGAQREIRFRPARACPPALVQLAAEFFGPDGKLLPEKYTVFDRFLSGARRLDHELRCYDDTLIFLAEMRDAERRREQIRRAFPQGIGSTAFKNLLKISMYDY